MKSTGWRLGILACAAVCLGASTEAEELTYESLSAAYESNLADARKSQDAWGDGALEKVVADYPSMQPSWFAGGEDLQPSMPIPIPGVGKHLVSWFPESASRRYGSYELPDTVDASFDPMLEIPLDVTFGWKPRDTVITMSDMPGVGDVSVRTTYTYPNDDHWTFISEVYKSKMLRQTLPTDSYQLETGTTSSRGGDYGWTRTSTPSRFAVSLIESENDALGISKAD